MKTKNDERQETTRVIRDEAKYRELLEPFPSFSAANEAAGAFFEEVREARNRYKIPDALVILKGSALTNEGAEGVWITAQHNGSELEREQMAAWAAGYEAAERQRRIEKVTASASVIKNEGSLK